MWLFSRKHRGHSNNREEFEPDPANIQIEILGVLKGIHARLDPAVRPAWESSAEFALLNQSLADISRKLGQMLSLMEKPSNGAPGAQLAALHSAPSARLVQLVGTSGSSDQEPALAAGDSGPKVKSLADAISDAYLRACQKQARGGADTGDFLRFLGEFSQQFLYREYSVYRSGNERVAQWATQQMSNFREWRAIEGEGRIYLIPVSQMNGDFSDANAELAYEMRGKKLTSGGIVGFKPAVVEPRGAWLIVQSMGSIQIQ